MKFLQVITIVLLLLNLIYTGSILRETIAPDPTIAQIQELKEHTMIRDTQLIQSILMLHHEAGLHEAGQEFMCPICDQIKKQMQMVSK